MELTDDKGKNVQTGDEDANCVDGEREGRVPAGEGHEETGGGRDQERHTAQEPDSGRKRSKRRKQRDLAELLSRKNEMLQELENRLAELEQDNAKYEDKLLRLAAEFENYRKRTRREWELHEKSANAGLIAGLLGVLDDFDRALAASGDAGGNHFREGISMIYAALIDALSRNGLSEIEARGAVFEPQFHEAVGEMESAEVEAGRVAEVVRKGYKFHDQVLRPARVIVARGAS